MKKNAPVPIALTAFVILALIRILFPERQMGAAGPRALLDTAFSLGFFLLMILVATSIGAKALRWFRFSELSEAEHFLFSATLGLGILSYGILLLGLASQLSTVSITILLILTGAWGITEWSGILSTWGTAIVRFFQDWKRYYDLPNKVLIILAGIIFFLALLQVLTPPQDYDGLVYHLQGPNLFLKAGEIRFVSEPWPANLPMTIEMLFTYGLAYGSDAFAGLINFNYGLLLILAVYLFTRRFFGISTGRIAIFLFPGIPVLSLWITYTSNDMGWMLYAFLGLYLFSLFRAKGQTQYLILSGLISGLALGSKTLSLPWVFILGLLTLWYERQSLKKLIKAGVMFAAPALLVGSPWYLKNWMWTGNPVYPFYFGGIGWDTMRLDLLNVYMGSFGTGRRLIDYLLIPVNLYIHHAKFALVANEMPHILFPLALVFPLYQKNEVARRLGTTSALYLFFWTFGVQHTRYLLPIFPGLSILTALVLPQIIERSFPKFHRGVLFSLLIVPMFVTLFYQVALFKSNQPFKVILGTESKDAFLSRAVNDFTAIQFIREHLPKEAQVLMMWDGRGYYCGEQCPWSGDQFLWSAMVLKNQSVYSLAHNLRQMGVTHLMFNGWDASWFIEYHDPAHIHLDTEEYFLKEFAPACAREIYSSSDNVVRVFELVCP
jgi:4-amino-4-deoxy-L-arabinose transferase-like glycosyltransferase